MHEAFSANKVQMAAELLKLLQSNKHNASTGDDQHTLALALHSNIIMLYYTICPFNYSSIHRWEVTSGPTGESSGVQSVLAN